MPLVLITGIPSSGKSTRAAQIKEYLEKEHNKTVHIVSENEVITSSNLKKNALYLDSSKEKEIRSIIKSEVQRLVSQDAVVIIDAANYIKGYRYEIYCMSKSCKTTQCTVHCETSTTAAWDFNVKRSSTNNSGDEVYSQDIFDALVMRYEAPDSRNRWDSPLILVQAEDNLPKEKIACALFDRKPPPPNQSTQNAPLSATNYLHELDRITQDIVTAIMSAQNMGIEGDIKIPGQNNLNVKLNGNKLTAAQLGRHRRQFLTYSKMHPSSDTSRVASLFVQFLNSSLSS
ncbi:protein KTI12 homolog [Thrips palmi]|uniref:Protein KTI12 homolog n=1 Tax=Thrips palmi TaxID=161013 RepID=A0A6P8YXF6_THRPL|nr:protein KTI12 homolog [Thrips palmi]